MANDSISMLNDVLQKDNGSLLQSWVESQVSSPTFRPDRESPQDLSENSRRFLSLLRDAVKTGDADIMGAA